MNAKAGATVTVRLHLRLGPGYHVNSNTPSDEYLIPLRLTWEAAPLEVVSVEYPKGHLERYAFSEKPLSVYTGDFDVQTQFKAPEKAAKGTRRIVGKVRYQACTETMCFPPRSLSVEVPIEIR